MYNCNSSKESTEQMAPASHTDLRLIRVLWFINAHSLAPLTQKTYH